MLHTCHHEFTPSHCYTRMYFRVYEVLVVDGGGSLALFVIRLP